MPILTARPWLQLGVKYRLDSGLAAETIMPSTVVYRLAETAPNIMLTIALTPTPTLTVTVTVICPTATATAAPTPKATPTPTPTRNLTASSGNCCLELPCGRGTSRKGTC